MSNEAPLTHSSKYLSLLHISFLLLFDDSLCLVFDNFSFLLLDNLLLLHDDFLNALISCSWVVQEANQLRNFNRSNHTKIPHSQQREILSSESPSEQFYK